MSVLTLFRPASSLLPSFSCSSMSTWTTTFFWPFSTATTCRTPPLCPTTTSALSARHSVLGPLLNALVTRYLVRSLALVVWRTASQRHTLCILFSKRGKQGGKRLAQQAAPLRLLHCNALSTSPGPCLFHAPPFFFNVPRSFCSIKKDGERAARSTERRGHVKVSVSSRMDYDLAMRLNNTLLYEGDDQHPVSGTVQLFRGPSRSTCEVRLFSGCITHVPRVSRLPSLRASLVHSCALRPSGMAV